MREEENSTEIKTGGANYCLKCWSEFTTMTPEERKIYDLIKKSLSKEPSSDSLDINGHRGREIICNETGIKYISLRDCARDIGSNAASLSRHLSFGKPTRVKGLTFSYI